MNKLFFIKLIHLVFGVPVEKNARLHNFPPFRIAIYVFLGLNGYYIIEECLPIASSNLKSAYIAFTKHDFITSSSKYFAATIAIIIAWQRSIISDLQLKAQNNSNNISNYFSIQEHISSHVEENYNKISPNNLTLTSKSLFFYYIFKNPSEGDFSPSDQFKEFTRQLNNDIEDLINDCIRLNHLTIRQVDNYHHTGDLSTLPDSLFNYFIHNRKLKDHETSKTFDSLLEEIINSIRKISYSIRNNLEYCGLKANENYHHRLFKQSTQSIFIQSLIDYIREVILHPPISQKDKQSFEQEINSLYQSINDLDSIVLEWIGDMPLP